MLRHSISFKANREFNPRDLFSLVKEWLLKRSQNSCYGEEDLAFIQNSCNFTVEKEKEKLTGFVYNENGLSFAITDYQIKEKKAIYFVSIMVMRNLDGTFISGKLNTFSDNSRVNHSSDIKAGVPGIFKIMFRAARGGVNGSFPILMEPLEIDYNEILKKIKSSKNRNFIPILYLQDNTEAEILSKELYAKVTVIVSKENELLKSQIAVSKSKKGIIALLKQKKDKKIFYAKIIFPDGEVKDIDSLTSTQLITKIKGTIITTQSCQFSPIDFRYISIQRDILKKYYYKAPNNYSEIAFQVSAGLSAADRATMLESARTNLSGRSKTNLKNDINKIIIFPEHQTAFEKTSVQELIKILVVLS